MSKLKRRTLCERLEALAGRLDGDVGARRSLDAALSRVEAGVAAIERARSEADDQRARLALALAQVTEGVVLADEGGEIVFRNGPAEVYAGARHGDALAEHTLVGLLRRALQGEQATEPLDLYGPPRRTLVISAFPLEQDGRVIGALAMVDDVSERRRLDSVRRDFVANIGHELKTPVGALGILSEALVDEVEGSTGEVNEVVRRLADRMQTEAVRLGHIIDDLLDLSRIEAEEVPRREPVPVHVLVAEAVERVRTKADHRAVALQVNEPDLGVLVVGDPRQLTSAIENLLENAVKYSDDGSVVRVWAGLGERADMVAIIVEDQGIGIPDRDIRRIFERFYRVDRARARDTGGTGLGLSIVRHVAHNHGGEVEVRSREGEGSTFTLLLPPGSPTFPSGPAPAPSPQPSPPGAGASAA